MSEEDEAAVGGIVMVHEEGSEDPEGDHSIMKTKIIVRKIFQSGMTDYDFILDYPDSLEIYEDASLTEESLVSNEDEDLDGYPLTEEKEFWLKGLQASASHKDTTITLRLRKNEQVISDVDTSIDVTLINVDIAVDKDRSGTENDPGIQFGGADKTAEDDPYVFWVNNDYDEGSDDEALDNEPTRGDYLDGQISNTRDLEDFSRLWLNVGSILTQLKDGTMRLGLDWQGCTNTLCIYA